MFEEIFAYTFLGIILLICIIGLIKGDDCTKSKWHDYERISERYVPGNDIGFGITNGFTTDIVEKCKHCGKEIHINYE